MRRGGLRLVHGRSVLLLGFLALTLLTAPGAFASDAVGPSGKIDVSVVQAIETAGRFIYEARTELEAVVKQEKEKLETDYRNKRAELERKLVEKLAKLSPRATRERDKEQRAFRTELELLDTARQTEHSKLDAKLAEELPKLQEKFLGLDVRVLVLGTGLDQALSAAGASNRERLKAVVGEAVTAKVGKLLELAASGSVKAIMADVPVQPTTGGVDDGGTPVFALANLYPEIVGAEAAWSKGYTGAGVGIAVIDSGVNPLADFGSRLVQVRLDGQPTITDTYGHGTFVAGVTAGRSADGRFVGIAPDATVYGLNATGIDGSVYSSDVIAALDWVLANHEAHNIRVVNLSLAESVPSSYQQNLLDTAVERLWRAGVVVVASSGNSGPGTVNAPANDPFVISVGAVDTAETGSTSDDIVASFTSRGTTQDGFAKPELFAPGRRVVSTLAAGTVLAGKAPAENIVAFGYAKMSGTSFSAPQVAGAAAILLQQHPDWTPDQVKWVLLETSSSLLGGSDRTLDLDAAVNFSGVPGSANGGLTPATFGLEASSSTDLTGASWNAASWNGASWNGASWNGASWNGASWNGASWNGASWNAASWNSFDE